ncbi:hypothetical protein [Yoonia sp.]|uniref:hypothetical protein n=1 Tax=Yoonia sp. TaxID=2212373 RepID=UPI002DFA4408|nr:hypothetical protein [Yoonia sp.]
MNDDLKAGSAWGGVAPIAGPEPQRPRPQADGRPLDRRALEQALILAGQRGASGQHAVRREEFDALVAAAGASQLFDAEIQDIRGILEDPAALFRNAGLSAPEIVDELPMSISDNYTGRLVFLTTDSKLYRFTAQGVWERTVPAVDITGQLTNEQIAEVEAAKIAGKIGKLQIADVVLNDITAAQAAADAADVRAASVRDDHDALVTGFTGTISDAFDGVTASISSLQVTTDTSITAINGELNTVNADLQTFLGDLTDVQSEISAVYDGTTGQVKATALAGYYTKAEVDSSISADVSSLEATILTPAGQVRSTLLTGYYTRADADAALSAAVTSLEAEIDGVSATVTDEALARADADSALSGQITNLTATVTSNNSTLSAAIQNAETVSADADAVLASDITTLSATLSNFSAQSVFSESWMANDAISSWEQHSNGLGEVSVIEVADSPVGSRVLNVGNNSGNDEYWASSSRLIPFDSTRLYKMTVVARQISGSGSVYFGYTGMAADGVTFCNAGGLDNYSSQHYHAASGQALGTEWTTFVGYSKGFGTPNGNVGAATAESPKTMHENVRFIRPMLIVGYNDEPGQVQIASIVVEDVTEVQNASTAIQAEAVVRANEDAALATSITSLFSEIGSVSADLSTNYYTRAATDTAIATAQTALQASIEGVSSNLSTDYLTSAETNAAIASESTSLQAQIGTVQANLNTESAARVSEDTALSSQITSLTADLGSLSASVTENYLTATETNQAIAASATTLDASIDSVSSTVTQQGSAIATLEGNASAGYLIKAQAGGSVSLLDLVAADGVGGSVSVARIAADDILLDGSVRASKLLISDRSNMLPDPGLDDPDSWFLGGNFVIGDAGPSETAEKVMRWEGPTSTGDAYAFVDFAYTNEYIKIDPTRDYAVGGVFRTNSGGMSGRAQTQILFYDQNKGLPIRYALVKEHTVGGTTLEQKYSAIITPPANAVYARFRMRVSRDADGNVGGPMRWYHNFLRPAVSGELIVDGSITADKIVANAVTAGKIATGAISAEKIATGAIVSDKIAANAITSAKIEAGSVTATKIAGNTITGDKIVANTITGGLLATSGIITQTAQIGSGLITNAKIASAAISSAKIANGAITNAKIQNAAITNAKIDDAAITNVKIDDGAITTAKIGTAAITTAKIGDLQVNTFKIGDNSVTTAAFTQSAATYRLPTKGSYYTFMSLSFSGNNGQQVFADFYFEYRTASGDSDRNAIFDWRVLFNGSVFLSKREPIRDQSVSGVVSRGYLLTPTSGTQTILFQARDSSPNFNEGATDIFFRNASALMRLK